MYYDPVIESLPLTEIVHYQLILDEKEKSELVEILERYMRIHLLNLMNQAKESVFSDQEMADLTIFYLTPFGKDFAKKQHMLMNTPIDKVLTEKEMVTLGEFMKRKKLTNLPEKTILLEKKYRALVLGTSNDMTQICRYIIKKYINKKIKKS